MQKITHKYFMHIASRKHRQTGFTILELLVGMFIGLLILSAAFGSFVLTLSTSALSSEIGLLQQQASYTLRIIGGQIRQAGVYEVKKKVGADYSFVNYSDLNPIVSGNQDQFDIRYQASKIKDVDYDCLGNKLPNNFGDPNIQELSSRFEFKGTTLSCGQTQNALQPIIDNIASHKIMYRVFEVDGAGNRTYKFLNSLASSSIQNVSAIEICLDLQSDKAVIDKSLRATSTYVDCENQEHYLTDGKLHRVFHNTFSLRGPSV